MAQPLQSAIMKHVGAPALMAVGTGAALAGSSLIGVAFLGYGVQSELSRWIREGAAAIIIGVALIAGSLILVALIARKTEVATDRGSQDLVQPRSESGSSLISSNLSEFARTAVIGISTRRPIAVLAIAAALGAAMLVMSEFEKDARQPHGRKLA